MCQLRGAISRLPPSANHLFTIGLPDGNAHQQHIVDLVGGWQLRVQLAPLAERIFIDLQLIAKWFQVIIKQHFVQPDPSEFPVVGAIVELIGNAIAICIEVVARFNFDDMVGERH